MAGVIGFITSFFDNSEKAEESIDQEVEADKRTTEIGNLEDLDNNQQSSPEDRLVCKFFLEGKCRFGEKCKNIHEAGQGNAEALPKSRGKPTEKDDKEIIIKKKPSMRTAEDVKNPVFQIQIREGLPGIQRLDVVFGSTGSEETIIKRAYGQSRQGDHREEGGWQ